VSARKPATHKREEEKRRSVLKPLRFFLAHRKQKKVKIIDKIMADGSLQQLVGRLKQCESTALL
jgi:hypothetical protein